MRRRSLPGAGPLLALLVCAGGLPAQPPERFSEKLIVREREILVDPPDASAEHGLAPASFLVLVDGQPREVTRAEPAAGDWTIVLYVDEVLARPGTVFYSGLALANRAAELTRMGSVEVVVAGSDPRLALAPTREAKRVEQVLTDLSATARVERDQAEGRAHRDLGPSPPQIRRQLDKLLAFLAARRPSGPHAVFLIADGPDLPPEQSALLERQDAAGATGTPAAVFHRAARVLAAYGWVAIPVPLRKEGVGIEIAPQSEIEIFRESSAPSDHQNGVPPILPHRPPKKTTLAFTGVIDLFVEPKTAALRVLSRATAGTVIGFEQQIGPTLAALSRRWRLWIAEPDAPVDGRLHSLAVTLADRERMNAALWVAAVSVPGTMEIRPIRAPGWVRSSTPEEIAEARLGELLAGRPAGGDLPFTAAVRYTPGGLELRLEMEPLPTSESSPSAPLRLSWAFSGEEGATGMGHEILPGTEPGKRIRHGRRIAAPPGTRQIAVVVEALGPERWGGSVLKIPPATSL
jgi:hypothetical protein